jgi:hypothetical protein
MHIQSFQREYLPINDTVDLMKPIQKGVHVTGLENFDIELCQHCNKLMNEQNTGELNPIYQLLHDIKMKHACM